MKKTLSYLLIILLSFSFTWGKVFSSEDTCGTRNGFDLYNCRVENVCEQYKSEKPTYSTEDYEEADNQTSEFHGQQSAAPALYNAKQLYRENIGNIYKCAIIQAQKNSLDFIKKQLSNELDDTIGGQIDLRVNRLELSANKIGCSLSDKQQVLNKLNVLRETTYEMCRYTSYLEYLKAYYAEVENNTRNFTTEEAIEAYWSDQLLRSFPSEGLPQLMDGIQNDIAQEISHTYKVFPLAYHAYSDYENNFPIHFLLEIVRWDFLLLRQWLYETLMPLAQLGLKVINAMSY